MARPLSTDHAPYFSKYIDLIEGDDIKEAFAAQQLKLEVILNAIPDSKADYAYAEGKWTVKQLIQHLIDTERIFAHRAHWIARRANVPLPGFDENAFAEHADVSKRSLQELKNEFIAVRNSTHLMFDGFTNDDLAQRGTSNTKELTVNAAGFITLGHLVHHFNVLKERYL